MSTWPDYACAILEDGRTRLLLESRPGDARHAAGRLTCFGGRREPNETPEDCVRRELREELSWEPRTLVKRVELFVAKRPVAWFYHAFVDVGIDELRIASGGRALFVNRGELARLPVSRWHAAVLDAWFAGRITVELAE